MLTLTLRQGAQRLLATAIESEVNDFFSKHAEVRDEQGRRQVVRNGYLPSRETQTGIGSVSVQMPRIRNNSAEEIVFRSSLLPPYLKRTKSVEALIPWLYLKGISTGDMNRALEALLGERAKGLSAKNIGHLTRGWQSEYEAWCQRDLSTLRIAYVWADGVYLHARLEAKQCLLVLMGADESGKKHLLGIESGERESKQSWRELLLSLKGRGLNDDIKLGIGDGAVGFWGALNEVFPKALHQCCWVHKTMNILNKLPKTQQPTAKSRLQQIWMAKTHEDAKKAFDGFISAYEAQYPKAASCLSKDKDALLSFFNFPAQHWHHIQTTNSIESLFATVRLRTGKTRGCLSRTTGLAMVFKLATVAETKWPRLRGSGLVADVIHGVNFKDGKRVEQTEKITEHAA